MRPNASQRWRARWHAVGRRVILDFIRTVSIPRSCLSVAPGLVRMFLSSTMIVTDALRA
jgi:hypothetical protein